MNESQLKKMEPLINELRFKAEEVNGVAMEMLLNTTASIIESQCSIMDTAFATIDQYGQAIDEMQKILQQIWDQDGYVDEDLKGIIRTMVEVNRV